ncbi:PAS domain-containing sensor histidine kinase [Mycetocola manganoxydans]|uniref:histidine kinase n=1 Tax=Mycetocola manganoxydans TaxID=699879 RepID=A0A3L7A1N1_9MICO|nr:ATP-binding protein [Mycetocola manganoxydans]RLP73471.1 PAS domain-containing sensor histidine kinase [Mycetocola manganoxydans]GHD41567.1 two-component sensor histidine kinase [Mycetocola manganoxydans]
MSPLPAAELGARWFGYRAEVAIQVSAVAIVGCAIAIALVVDPTPLQTPAFAIAMGILALATILALIIGRTSSQWLLLVPMLDMVALIVMRQLPEQHVHAIGYLAILPALWLGWSGKFIFASLAVVLSLGMFEAPGMGGGGLAQLEHALLNLLIPAVAAVAAGSTFVASRRTAASIRSLTEQQATTAASLAREKRTSALLDSILDAVDVGILAYDADGNSLLSNRTVKEHPIIVSTGLTPLELEQQEYLLEADRVTRVPAEQGFVTQAIDGKEFRDRLVWIAAPGTRQHALSASARPLIDADGAFAGTVVAVEDVTVYLEALSAKDALVGSVSHEFRTPLASIVGYLELIMDDPDVPDGILNNLTVIERNTDRLQSLVSDLLEEASRERGSVKLERELHDVGALCAAVVDRCAPAADAAGVRLGLDAPAGISAVLDRRRVSQAVDNLVANALRFTPRGGTVDVRVAEDMAANRVRISVQDSGMGMPPEEMEALASPFYRSKGAGEHFPGVGLAVTVTKGIVDAHGGELDFLTEPGAGTTATVSLPVR